MLRNEIKKDITLIKKGPKPSICAINLIGSNNFFINNVFYLIILQLI